MIIKKQKLFETLVLSSWLKDISYYNEDNMFFPGEEIITFTCCPKGRWKTYFIRGLSKEDFDKWIKAPSKGKHWHRQIKNSIDRSWVTNFNRHSTTNLGKKFHKYKKHIKRPNYYKTT